MLNRLRQNIREITGFAKSTRDKETLKSTLMDVLAGTENLIDVIETQEEPSQEESGEVSCRSIGIAFLAMGVSITTVMLMISCSIGLVIAASPIDDYATYIGYMTTSFAVSMGVLILQALFIIVGVFLFIRRIRLSGNMT